MITKQFEDAWNYDNALFLKESLAKQKQREYYRRRILEIDDIKEGRGEYERKTLKWVVPEEQKPKKTKKTLLGLLLSNF